MGDFLAGILDLKFKIEKIFDSKSYFFYSRCLKLKSDFFSGDIDQNSLSSRKRLKLDFEQKLISESKNDVPRAENAFLSRTCVRLQFQKTKFFTAFF